MRVARVVFVVAAAVGAWWGLRGRTAEVGDALSQVPAGRLALALVAVVVGLGATLLVWRALLGWLGHRLTLSEAARIFFPGQLGKYIPGSVWSIGAQAASAARRGVPARDVAATGLLFLGVHVASAGLAAGLLGLVRPPVDGPARWVWVLGAVLGLAAMSVPVLRLVGSRLAGHRPEVPIGQWWSMLGAMTTAWASYSMATGLLLPDPGWRAVATAALAFAMAYAVGVVVVIAPAGVGAREATFVAVTAPTIGVGAATATALLTRVVHTVADVAWAAVATRMGKRAPERVSG